MGHPTIYPTGVTLYDPAKAWNGYTIFPAADLGALLIDMNGSEVQLWRGLRGFPNKLLPNGQVFGSTGLRDPAHSFQDQTDLVQVDWDGNIVWRFSHLEHIADPGQEPRWYARPAPRLSARRQSCRILRARSDADPRPWQDAAARARRRARSKNFR